MSKTDITQSTGTSETSVMSQKAVSDIVYELEGKVTNVADEEDLTSVNVEGTDVLKFKDKVYNPLVYSGLGRKILRKNIINGVNTLTQSMINQQNTIYVIQYDFTLGKDITVPENCVLEFDGGSISNGNVILNNTIIVAPQRQVFYNINLKGSCKGKFNLWWNGIDFSASCTQAIQRAIDVVQNSNATLYIPNGTYLLTVQEKDPSFSKNYAFHLYIRGCIRIEGESQEKTILKRVSTDLTEITEEEYYTPGSNWGGLNTEYGSLIGVVVKESFNTFYDGIFEIANITLDGGMPWKHYMKNSPSVYGDKLINIINDGKKISKILVKNTSFKNASIEACYGQWGSYDNTTAIYEGCVFYNIGGSAGNTGGKYCKFYNCRFEYCRNAIEHTPSYSTGFGYFEVQECIFHNCFNLFSHNIQTNKTPASTMETWCANKTVIFKNNMCVNDIEFVKEMYAIFGNSATIRGFTISACNIAFITGNYFKNVANYNNSGSLLFGDSSSSTGGTLVPAKCILITNNYIDSEERINLIYSGSAKLVILNNNTISSLYGNARSITYGETSVTVKTPNYIMLAGYETSPKTKYKNNEFLYNYIITDSHGESNIQHINFAFPLNKKIHAYITMKNIGDTTGKVSISLLYNVNKWVTGVSKELVANAESTSHLILPCSLDYSSNGIVCVGDFMIWNNIPVEITLRFILDDDVVDMDYMPMWSNTDLYYKTKGITKIPTILPSSKGVYASRPTSGISVGYGYFATDKGVSGKGAMIYYTGDANTSWVYSDGTPVS